MKENDSSHDFFHILRVRNLALHIAKCEKIAEKESLLLIELVSYLHDINDHKYKSSNESESSKIEKLRNILSKHNITNEFYYRKLFNIINNISFSKENKILTNYKKYEAMIVNEKKTSDAANININEAKQKYENYMNLINKCVELRIVQDADRLDAIGAIGIGRTFTYSGSRNVSMFNFVPNDVNQCQTKLKSNCNDCIANESQNSENMKRNGHNIDEWIANDLCKGTCIGHFFEKLLLLKDLMKTDTGKQMALERTQFMKSFVKQFCHEWDISHLPEK